MIITQSSHNLLQPARSNYSNPNSYSLLSEMTLSLFATDPDTIHLDEALQKHDKDKFLEAMAKELKDHIKRKNWKAVPLKYIPKDKSCLPMVWPMKRKKNPLGKVIKYMASLCVGGHRSIDFIDYWYTYSPVVSWQTIRLIFILAIVNNWHVRSIDFVLAFSQADVKTDIFLKTTLSTCQLSYSRSTKCHWPFYSSLQIDEKFICPERCG